MKTKTLLMCLVAAICIWGCSNDNESVIDVAEAEITPPTAPNSADTRHSYKPVQLSETQLAINGKLQEFSWRLFKEVYVNREDRTNLMISPISLAVDLGMFINGLNGETLQEVLKTMGLEGFTKDQINDYFKTMMTGIEQADEAAIFKSANAFWYNQNRKANQDFLTTIQTSYDAKAEAVNFSDPQTVVKINAWCAEQTYDRIKEMITESSEADLFHLMNAVFFKTQWKEAFPKELTAKQPFKFANGNTEDVEMMNQQYKAFYVETDSYQSVVKDFVDSAFQMVFFLPKDGIDMIERLPSVISKEAGSLEKVVEMDLFVPKFTAEYTERKLFTYMLSINPALRFHANDITIFEDAIFEDPEAMQKTFFAMDEEGAEAAAITDISYVTANLKPDDFEKVELRLNRPFFYAIVESNTYCPLFIGYYGN